MTWKSQLQSPRPTTLGTATATNGSMYDHIKIVGQVLEALQAGGIKLRPEKLTSPQKPSNSLELFGIEEYSIFLNTN